MLIRSRRAWVRVKGGQRNPAVMSAALIAVVVIESLIIAGYIGWRVYTMYNENNPTLPRQMVAPQGGGAYQQAPRGSGGGGYQQAPAPRGSQQVPPGYYGQPQPSQPRQPSLYYANGGP